MKLHAFRFMRKLFPKASTVGLCLCVLWQSAEAARCLFVSSYHQGYAWSDGVERGLRSTLNGQCDLRQFDMDTKRHKNEEFKRKAALEAKALIESWRPDVVIAADDNAAKYLIAPYFRDSEVPFVFCGINWTVEEYGFPYRNVTGMLEVAPIRLMLKKAVAASGKRAFYLGADTLTERKNLQHLKDAAEELGIELDGELTRTTDAWLTAYRRGQDYDFVVLGSNSGIDDWEDNRVQRELMRVSKRLSVTNHGWMMSYAMLGLTKIPEEQGEWGAKTALAILQGLRPTEIPIIANRKWDVRTNEPLLRTAGIDLPRSIKAKVKRVE